MDVRQRHMVSQTDYGAHNNVETKKTQALLWKIFRITVGPDICHWHIQDHSDEPGPKQIFKIPDVNIKLVNDQNA